MQLLPILILVLVAAWAVRKYLKFRQVVNSVGDFPGHHSVFSLASVLFRSRIPGIAPGRNSPFDLKYQDFADAGQDVVSYVNVLPEPQAVFCIADPATLKEVTLNRARFPKPVEDYKVLSFFGSNILITEDAEWKRQRKIAAPAFSESNNRLVWDEAQRIVLELFQDVWGSKDEITIDNIVDLTAPIVLFVISGAAFGRRVSWADDEQVPPGHTLTFKHCMHITSMYVHLKVVFADWQLKWSPFKIMRDTYYACSELQQYLEEMVRDGKADRKRRDKFDLLNLLLDANMDGNTTLSDSELIGNTFLLLFAGYETTAHTLAFVFALLALYPEEQDNLYEHIKKVIPDDRLPTYEDMGALSYSKAVINEALRMFPPVITIPKMSAEDTTLTTMNSSGEKVPFAVPKGARISIHLPGLHYNPRIWEDPLSFKPARFLDDWPREAFLPFSGGPRACLGRRFAETESVVILTMFVLRYKISIKEEPQFAGETFEQRKTRLLKCKNAITISPERVPLVFKRR